MRVLVLYPFVPALAGHGGQVRAFHLFGRLVGLGHEVTVICPIPADQAELAEAARAVGIDLRGPVRPPSRVKETARTLARRPALIVQAATQPLQAWQLSVLGEELRETIAGALDERPDVVLVGYDLAAHWRAFVSPGVPVMAELVDASWAYLDSRAKSATGPTARFQAFDAARMRRHARRWLPRYDRVICVSEVDAERAAALVPGIRPEVVANGVDLNAFRPSPDPGGPPTVLFTGSMNYPPNHDGALWLAREVWPRVRAALPDATLQVVGRHPGPEVRALAGNGIAVPGGVASMAPFFAAAQVVAVPILAGGGTRLKILEAAASGRPIVSTRQGAEGLDLDAVLLADPPDAFAAALIQLLGEPARRAELAALGRAQVEARYGWAALGERLSAVLSAAA